MIRVDKKTILITGATSGIGRATATELAKRGHRVILASRQRTLGLQVIEEIQRETSNLDLSFMELDLASQTSIKLFCQEFNKRESRLDVLINNAAVMKYHREVSEDGHEMSLAVNFLGPFLLTYLLLDKLCYSAPSCIVNVTSKFYEDKPVNFDDIQTLVDYDGPTTYGRSKSALIMLTGHLAKLLKPHQVSVFSVHPGVVQTNLMRELPLFKSALFRAMFPCLMRVFARQAVVTSQEACKTAVFCALDEAVLKDTGCHFTNCQKTELKDHVLNSERNRELWDIACKLCSVNATPDALHVNATPDAFQV